MQAKVEFLRNDIDKLEDEKTKAKSDLFTLKRRIGESEETLAQERKEIGHMDQESKSDNTSSSSNES